MKIFQSKKIFLAILVFSFFFNFLPLCAESNFKPPVLNSTDIRFNGPINAVVRDKITGIIYVGGTFTKVGEIERNNLAAIGSDGTLLDWNPNVSGISIKTEEENSPSSSINALAIKDSTVYVGGSFNKIGTRKRNNLAAIGTDGSIKSWNPDVGISSSLYPYILTIVIKDSTIYVGGSFSKIGKRKRNNLAAIGADGTLKGWNPNVNNSVKALTIKDSTIYIGGRFTKVGNTERNHLAAIGINGTLLDWNPSVDDSINALAISDSTIYIGGSFNKIGKRKRNNLAAIGTDGTLLDWNPNVNYIPPVQGEGLVYVPGIDALAINDSTIYVGGSFTSIGGTSRNRLAAIGINGTLLDWNPNINSDNNYDYASIYALAINDSTLYVGGSFTKIDNELRSNFASFSISK